ncbi:protein of unknown function [Candidatus Nitrospira inopinata]|jgi:hypothetical protein|uniref:Uncharacterized protein n=1 Tax=Candidatus Nitrospira inopinata TaxID=1715989 RepID=A0A0S4KV93_9BACT|nr:protein of unknown function [Candidatus Nitrospira inopinata]
MTREPHPRLEDVGEDGMVPLYMFPPPVETDRKGKGLNALRFRGSGPSPSAGAGHVFLQTSRPR